MAAALATTTGLALWQAREATQRFEQVRRLAESLLFEIHDAVAPLPGSIAASKLITARSLEYLDEIARNPRASLDLQLNVVRGYLRLSELAGIEIGGRSMGDSSGGQVLAQKALDVARRLASAYPSSLEVQAALADSLVNVASAMHLRGLDKESLPGFDEAVQIASKLNAAQPGNPVSQERLAYALKQAAGPRFRLKMSEKGLQLAKQSLDLRHKIFDVLPNSPMALQKLSESYLELASHYGFLRDFDRFPPYARESYRLTELRYRRDPRNSRFPFSAAIAHMAVVAMHNKDYPDAIRLYLEIAKIRREIVDEDPRDVNAKVRYAAALDRVGNTYAYAGNYPEAIRSGEEALQLLRKLHQEDPENSNTAREYLFAVGDLSKSYDLGKRLDRACPLAREFLANFNRAGRGTKVALNRHLDRNKTLLEKCP